MVLYPKVLSIKKCYFKQSALYSKFPAFKPFFYIFYKVQLNFTLLSKKSEKSDICKQIEASVAANIQNSQNISPIQNRQESKKDFFEKSCYKRNN